MGDFERPTGSAIWRQLNPETEKICEFCGGLVKLEQIESGDIRSGLCPMCGEKVSSAIHLWQVNIDAASTLMGIFGLGMGTTYSNLRDNGPIYTLTSDNEGDAE